MAQKPQQHAQNDTARANENGSVLIDVLANEARNLVSVHQSGDPTTTATLPSGAPVMIVDGQVRYETRSAWEVLPAGSTAADRGIWYFAG